jgi:hypothetical protein
MSAAAWRKSGSQRTLRACNKDCHLSLFAACNELVPLVILSPAIWLDLCCSAGRRVWHNEPQVYSWDMASALPCCKYLVQTAATQSVA